MHIAAWHSQHRIFPSTSLHDGPGTLGYGNDILNSIDPPSFEIKINEVDLRLVLFPSRKIDRGQPGNATKQGSTLAPMTRAAQGTIHPAALSPASISKSSWPRPTIGLVHGNFILF